MSAKNGDFVWYRPDSNDQMSVGIDPNGLYPGFLMTDEDVSGNATVWVITGSSSDIQPQNKPRGSGPNPSQGYWFLPDTIFAEGFLRAGQHGNQGNGSQHSVATQSVNGFMSAADKAKSDLIDSGTYTPTGSLVSGMTSLTPGLCFWQRIGNVVNVCGTVQATPSVITGLGATFRLTLPVASNLAAAGDLAGSGNRDTRIVADAAGDRAEVSFTSLGLTSTAVSFNFSYRIL